MDVSLLFGNIALYNTFAMRGKTILHDKRFMNYWIFSFVRMMTSSLGALTSANINDVNGVNLIGIVFWR